MPKLTATERTLAVALKLTVWPLTTDLAAFSPSLSLDALEDARERGFVVRQKVGKAVWVYDLSRSGEKLIASL